VNPFHVLCFLPFVLYAFFQWRAVRLWKRVRIGRGTPGPDPGGVRISVIIAARNEAGNLPGLLEALLLRQTRTPDEVLLVDDDSSDDTAAVVASWSGQGVRLLRAAGTGKRAALATGVQAARGEILLFTDGDCIPGPGWVAAMSAPLADGRARWVSGPVLVEDKGEAISRYDALESRGMMVVIAAGFAAGTPALAQGASMGLRREDLIATGGFQGLPARASGDDVFLLRRFAQAFPGRCLFIPDRSAIVRTVAPVGWRALLRQRLRWTSKVGAMGSFSEGIPMVTALLVSAGMLILLLGLPWWPAAVIPAVLAGLVLKVVADTAVLTAGCRFDKRLHLLRMLPWAALVHPLLVVLSGVWGPLRNGYAWKDRQVR